MVLTVGTVVWTHDLALGVFAGVLSARSSSRARWPRWRSWRTCSAPDGRERTYAVTGQLFFVTVTGFLAHFDFQEDVDRVVLDLSRSHIWDHSAVAAIDKAVLRFRRRGVEVGIVGLNEASATLVSRLAVHDKPGACRAIRNRAAPAQRASWRTSGQWCLSPGVATAPRAGPREG
jgi:sulfate permease, SulP family